MPANPAVVIAAWLPPTNLPFPAITDWERAGHVAEKLATATDSYQGTASAMPEDVEHPSDFSPCDSFRTAKRTLSTASGAVTFCHDWQGKNFDPQRQTEVRLLWNDATIFIRFDCSYRTIDVFPDSDPNGRRDALWDRDVAEIFLQPDRFGEKFYKEFEVSPNEMWLDLDITPEGLRHITSGMRSRVSIDQVAHVWTAELAIPIASITNHFDPTQPWRVNFFRCEGLEPDRFYSAWQPTETEKPNFHVPQKFGILRFEPQPSGSH